MQDGFFCADGAEVFETLGINYSAAGFERRAPKVVLVLRIPSFIWEVTKFVIYETKTVGVVDTRFTR